MSARSCPVCDQVHGRGNAGFLHPSGQYPSLLLCNWCGRYFALPNKPGGALRQIPQSNLWLWKQKQGGA